MPAKEACAAPGPTNFDGEECQITAGCKAGYTSSKGSSDPCTLCDVGYVNKNQKCFPAKEVCVAPEAPNYDGEQCQNSTGCKVGYTFYPDSTKFCTRCDFRYVRSDGKCMKAS